MIEHALMPALCADCLAVALTTAEMGPPNDRVVKLCQCAGDSLNVIAIGAKVNGVIRSWDVQGPLTKDQAEMLAAEIVRRYQKAGMRIHEIVRQ